MSNILHLIEEKVSPKYLIYLNENEYKLFKSIRKDASSIANNMIDNKIFEVLEIANIDNEKLYLIGVDNNELGWVSVKNPILILNSFSEKVSPLKLIKENPLNDVLGIQSTLNSKELYTAKYICEFHEELYVGLENNEEFLGFFPIESLNFGNIEEVSFVFNNSMVNVYLSYELTNSHMIISDEQKFVTSQYFENIGLGIVKIGKDNYWFKGNETNIDHSELKLIDKDYDEYYLEHLIQSIKIDKTLKSQGLKNNGGVNKEYVDSLNERAIQLKEKNVEHLENIRKLNKEFREAALELKRKNSKLDYLERLTTNQKKKLDYYEERNKKLNDRVELLEGKLNAVNNEYKQLKSSKLVKIQTKFLGK